MAEEKKNVLILGAVGFIGRNLIQFILENDLAAHVRAVDKTMPMVAYMSEAHAAAFKDERVTYVQADLAKKEHVSGRAFGGDMHFDYIVNLCGETRFGLSEMDYQLKCEQTAANCVEVALEHKPEKWVELSTAQVYKPDKNPSKETATIKPWTMLAKSRLKAEDTVKQSGLPCVVLRPANVYGMGDLTGLAPRIVSAAVYQKTGEKMKFLYSKDLKMHTVHVQDLCGAIWIACSQMAPGSTYNVADNSDFTQQKLAAILATVFGIQTGFAGAVLSTLATASLSTTAEFINEKHVPEWVGICNGINTPLSPFVDKELLKNQHMSINGSKITDDFEFAYTHTTEAGEIRRFVAEAIEQGIFPQIELH